MASSRSFAPSARPSAVGSETPRLWTRPLRKLTPKTSRGFEAIEFAETVLGVSLLPWQRWLLIHLLELLPDGSYRFRTALVLVARQNGKTTLMQVLSLWRMYVDGAGLVIGTAQNLDVAEEAWSATVEMAESVPELAVEIAHVDKTNGKKALRLVSGERYKVAAASRRGGRGLSGDLVLLDELREHQTWAAWSAVTKTTMARAKAQILGVSNAGDVQSVVLNHLRTIALKAEDSSVGIFEWSAPDGCPLDDPDGIAQANPSLGYTITMRAILGALETDPEDVFRTEVLCQWVQTITPPPIDPMLWAGLADEKSTLTGTCQFGVDVSRDGSHASIGVAGAGKNDRAHVEVIEHRRGTTWLLEICKALDAAWPRSKFVIDSGGPAGWLIPQLEAAGADVVKAGARDVGQAAGAFLDAVNRRALVHLGQTDLDEAVGAARQRPLGDSWTWGRKTSTSSDISPLVAVTLALWAHSTASVPEFFVY